MQPKVKKYVVQAQHKAAKWAEKQRKKRTKRIRRRQRHWTARTEVRQTGKTARTGFRRGGKGARVGIRQRQKELSDAAGPGRKRFTGGALPFSPATAEEQMMFESDYAPSGGGGEMFAEGEYAEESIPIMDQPWFWAALIGGTGVILFTMTKKKKR